MAQWPGEKSLAMAKELLIWRVDRYQPFLQGKPVCCNLARPRQFRPSEFEGSRERRFRLTAFPEAA